MEEVDYSLKYPFFCRKKYSRFGLDYSGFFTRPRRLSERSTKSDRQGQYFCDGIEFRVYVVWGGRLCVLVVFSDGFCHRESSVVRMTTPLSFVWMSVVNSGT